MEMKHFPSSTYTDKPLTWNDDDGNDNAENVKWSDAAGETSCNNCHRQGKKYRQSRQTNSDRSLQSSA